MMGVGPVHALPSTCLQKVEEQPEDADNQRNVTRMGSQPSDLSATVHIPVTLTGPPGETTVVPSEYLPVSAGQGPPYAGTVCSPLSPSLHGSRLGTEHACVSLSTPARDKVLCGQHLCLDVSLFPVPCPRGALLLSHAT